MAKNYKKKPSEILNIKDDYAAYCFDEAAYYMEVEALDDKGNYRWNRFRWTDEQKKNNKNLIEFIKIQR